MLRLVWKQEVDHTIDTSDAVTAVYPLKDGIVAKLRGYDGMRYHTLSIEFPSGSLANKSKDVLMKVGRIPYVRAEGHSSWEDGLEQLERSLKHANMDQPMRVPYHADISGDAHFLPGAMSILFEELRNGK